MLGFEINYQKHHRVEAGEGGYSEEMKMGDSNFPF